VNITELKRKLKESTREELLKDIVDLFKKNNFVKDYYDTKYSNSESILEKYKQKIKDEFFPNKGEGKERISVAKKAVTELMKLSQDKKQIADIMIYYVEIGVEYTDCYGDINEAFYYSMESMYQRALEFVDENDLQNEFEDRCLKIVNDTEGMGWGFHDVLGQIYYEYLFDGIDS